MDAIVLDDLKKLFDCIDQPMFAAEDGVVCCVNPAFRALGIEEGTPVERFLGTEVQYPQPMGEESAPFPCVIAGQQFTARVRPYRQYTLCFLHEETQTIPIQILARTSSRLRSTLHVLLNAALPLLQEAEEKEDDRLLRYSAAVLHSIYQVERLAGNLDYLEKLRSGSYTLNLQKTPVVDFLDDLFLKARDLLKDAGIHLDVQMPDKLFNGSLDRNLTELAIWNLLSNAGECSSNRHITVRVIHRAPFLQLDFFSCSRNVGHETLFTRCSLPIRPEDERFGVGVGLPLVRQIAMLHGGSLLLATAADGNICVSFTLRIDRPAEDTVRCRLPVVGGLSPALVGLSELLPDKAYDSRDIL